MSLYAVSVCIWYATFLLLLFLQFQLRALAFNNSSSQQFHIHLNHLQIVFFGVCIHERKKKLEVNFAEQMKIVANIFCFSLFFSRPIEIASRYIFVNCVHFVWHSHHYLLLLIFFEFRYEWLLPNPHSKKKNVKVHSCWSENKIECFFDIHINLI